MYAFYAERRFFSLNVLNEICLPRCFGLLILCTPTFPRFLVELVPPPLCYNGVILCACTLGNGIRLFFSPPTNLVSLSSLRRLGRECWWWFP